MPNPNLNPRQNPLAAGYNGRGGGQPFNPLGYGQAASPNANPFQTTPGAGAGPQATTAQRSAGFMDATGQWNPGITQPGQGGFSQGIPQPQQYNPRMGRQQFMQQGGWKPEYRDMWGQGYQDGNQWVSAADFDKMAQRSWQQGQGGFLGQAGAALGQDYQKGQDIENQLKAQSGNVLKQAQQGSQDIKNTAESTAKDLTALGERQRAEWEAGIAKTLGEYKDRSATDADAMSKGLRSTLDDRLRQIDSDPTMPLQAKEEAKRQARMDVGSQINTQISQIYSQYNQTALQAGLNASGQRIGSQQNQAQLASLAANERNAGALAAVQAGIQGYQAYEQYLNNIPLAMRFSGMLALGNLANSSAGSMGMVRL